MIEPELAPLPPRIEILGEDGMALRQLHIDDAQDYFELIKYDRDHLSQSHIGGTDKSAQKYQTVDDVIKSIVRPNNPQKLRLGSWAPAADSTPQVMVGTINLTPKSNQVAEIGYWIGAQYTGRGYATSSVQALSQYAFEQMDINLLFAHVFVGNDASRRTLEKAGFNYTNTFEQENDDGVIEQLWKFELAKDEPGESV